ncbi:unnamed protein product [Ceutorhynchus assimilis]|uniref:Uncharacterized protein n=1 Tax=Ceutorhynchus assimilis TaxID=467358 RepID=A0A9P0DLH0_9CUCU|nr:unnamed protein product [Ceutorhynchus assimilis]
MRTVIALMFIIVIHCSGKKYDFKLVHQWKQIEYKFSSEEERQEAIQNGTFDIGKVQPMDAQYTYNCDTGEERIFVTTPRLKQTGTPAGIGVIIDETRDGNPVIEPYPSWSWHINTEKCNYHRIVSPFRVWWDECDRLWISDTGIQGDSFICPPQILAFDLKTDKLLHKYEIPYGQYNNVSWYVSPIAEVESFNNKCENTWVYAANPTGFTLLVYSLKQNASWSVVDKSFKPDPDRKYANYTIGGDTYFYADGLITVALTPKSDGPENRKLRYHAMSNIKESWVYVKHLKNRHNFEVPNGASKFFHTYIDKRDQQSLIEATDRNGYVYFSLLIDVLLIKWNPNTPYKKENWKIIANDTERMQFPSGLKVLPYKANKHHEVLWVFAVAYQRFEAGTLFGNRTNFRLFVADIDNY